MVRNKHAWCVCLVTGPKNLERTKIATQAAKTRPSTNPARVADVALLLLVVSSTRFWLQKNTLRAPPLSTIRKSQPATRLSPVEVRRRKVRAR